MDRNPRNVIEFRESSATRRDHIHPHAIRL